MLDVEKIGQALRICSGKIAGQQLCCWGPIKLATLPNFLLLNKKVNIKSKGKIIELREERELYSKCTLVTQSLRGFAIKEVIGHNELSLAPRSSMNIDGIMMPGHVGKSKLMNAIIKCFWKCPIQAMQKMCWKTNQMEWVLA